VLFRQEFLDGIRTGRVTLAFRRWRRPSVRSGGTLLTPIGQLKIESVQPVTTEQISEDDARRAGFGSLEMLVSELRDRPEGTLYRIVLGPLSPDPRIALRESLPAHGPPADETVRRLDRLDARAGGGPWTVHVLEAVDANPGLRAGTLCKRVGQEKEPFKINVRKLKNLGLIESLITGYRLSPRGAAVLEHIRSTRRNLFGGPSAGGRSRRRPRDP
jgi:hypothetical protein